MHQTCEHSNLKYKAIYSTKIINRILIVILIENDIYSWEKYCQIRWADRKSDRALQKISKIVYFLLESIIDFGAPSSMGAWALAPFALWETSPW